MALRQRRHKQHQTVVSEHVKYSKCPVKRNGRKPFIGLSAILLICSFIHDVFSDDDFL